MRADTVFLGGSAFLRGRSVRAGVAVTDGRISAVGPDEQVRELVGPGTQVHELGGGLITAGFQDAHVHPVFAGALLLQCDLQDGADVAELVSRVQVYAAAHPDRAWITGGGWAMQAFPGGRPHRAALDAVVPDRPVFLTNRDGHGAWVNGAALRRAGIDRSTPHPPDGRIERDADGEPTGLLHEGAAMLVGRLLPGATAEDGRSALLAGQDHLLALGITAWQDAIVGPYLGRPDNLSTYLDADAAGELLVRVVGDLWWDRERGLEQLSDLRERRASAPTGGRFRPTTVKIMQDGIAENFTAAMTQPYRDACGCSTGAAGLSFVDPELLRRAVTALDADGFQVHLHALGDRAVREALDAVEAARAANGPRDARHHLAHLQVVHPDDVPRFAQLGATATIQPLWAVHEPQMDELTIPFLGDGLADRQYPFADLHAAGAALAAGSDWAVSSADPWAGIHVAVNRTAPDATGTPAFLPHQRLSLATALTAYTLGSARVNSLEQCTGTLEVGKDADLAVHDRDPFAAPAEEIGRTRVRQTWINGRLLHQAHLPG